jgi:enoyl-[acyl-carrier protein] reductase I
MAVLVIGTSSYHSIGYDIARHCRNAGLGTFITSRRKKFLGRLASEGFDSGYLDYPDHCDALSSLTAIEGVVFCLARTDVEELRSGILSTSNDNFENTMTTNCYALIDLTRRLRPHLAEHASIVALTFFGSTTVIPGYGLLGVAKAALEQTIRTLAWELGPHGIRVNGLSAGAVRTPSARVLPGFERASTNLAQSSCLRRAPERDEIAGTALWLLSKASGGVTGEIVNVNGGVGHVRAS